MAITHKRNCCFAAGIAGLMVFHHFSLWFLISVKHNIAWADILDNWDAGWYNQIISNGYTDQSRAFYPLYPFLIETFYSITGTPPQFLGAFISLLLFATFIYLVGKFTLPGKPNSLLAPATSMGWFLFIYSPGSFVFHSHHTEALFLLLSFGAFFLCTKKQFYTAAVVGGICALTRNQGILVSFTVGIWAAQSVFQQNNKSKSIVSFLNVGIISGGIFSIFLLYQWFETGNFFYFLGAQSNWAHIDSPHQWFATLWFGNDWQNTNTGSILHHIWFFVMLLAAFLLWKKNKPLGIYGFLSLFVMTFQGELTNSFRFSVVIFPVLFALGDWLSKRPKIVRISVVIVLIALNHMVTRNYALHRWAY